MFYKSLIIYLVKKGGITIMTKHHLFWIDKKSHILELIETGEERSNDNDQRKTRKGYHNPKLRESTDSTPCEIKLSPSQISLLQDLALKYIKNGRAKYLLDDTYNGNASHYKNIINKIFQDHLHDNFILISGGSTYKFNGEPYEVIKPFTISDFFDVFLSKINNVYFKNEPLKTGNLTSEQKEEIFFCLFGDNIAPNCEEILCKLYRTVNKSIKNSSVEEVFSEKRKKLKQLLVEDDIFSSEKTTEKKAGDTLKKVIREQNEKSINNWKNVLENIFPIPSDGEYYSEYKDYIIKKILSLEYETHIKIPWIKPIQEYDFSSKEQSEKDALDIDDLIVSLALVALSNYKIENESRTLKFERSLYIETIKYLFEQRFNPTTYSQQEENARDFKEILMKCVKMAYEEGMSEEQLNESFKTYIRKVYDNKNEYDNENNNDYTKKL